MFYAHLIGLHVFSTLQIMFFSRNYFVMFVLNFAKLCKAKMFTVILLTKNVDSSCSLANSTRCVNNRLHVTIKFRVCGSKPGNMFTLKCV